MYVPRIREIGLRVGARPGAAPGPRDWRALIRADWKELYAVVTGYGPRSAERLAFAAHYAETQWVRDTVMAAPVAA